MTYAGQKFYKNVHKGVLKDDGAKGRLAAASVLIDALTHNRIRDVGFENLTDFQKAAVRKACCLIADHMAQNGPTAGTDIDTFSIQDMRVRMRRRNLRPWETAGCGLWAWLTLMQTGLMRGELS